MDKFRFFVFGQFRVETMAQGDVTPRAAKGQGLLLLLLRSQHMLRSRRWLQDKLWSTRAQEQGANSLRQVLAQLRRRLGPNQAVFGADRQNVWLNPDLVEIIETAGGDLAEGLDVRDPEFEQWLAAERSAAAAAECAAELEPRLIAPPRAVAAQRIAVSINLQRGLGPGKAWAEDIMSDNVARLLREVYSVEIFDSTARNGADSHWRVSLESFAPTPEAFGLRASLTKRETGQQLWSSSRVVDADPVAASDHPKMSQLVGEIVEALGEEMMKSGPRSPEAMSADALCRHAVRRLFTMRPEEVAKADEMMARVLEIEDRGLYWAWRAQIRTIQRIERHAPDVDVLRESGACFASRALQMEPDNSMVLALVANTRLFLFGDASAALEMADRAVSINAANAMAWWALSSARLYTGDAEKSYQDAMIGRYLAHRSPYRFWWDLQRFAAAMLLGKTDEAISLLESGAAQCEAFRPPLRYLTALHANAGDEARAHKTLTRLKTIEGDFSVAKMIEDREYPASLVHKAEVLDLKRISAVLA